MKAKIFEFDGTEEEIEKLLRSIEKQPLKTVVVEKKIPEKIEEGLSMKEVLQKIVGEIPADSEFESRTPIKMTKTKYEKQKEGPKKYVIMPKRWKPEHDRAVEAFYKNPENHIPNGNINMPRLRAFSKVITRTPSAIQQRIISLELNRIMVRGKVFDETPGHEAKTMLRRQLRIPSEVIPTEKKRIQQFNRMNGTQMHGIAWPKLPTTTDVGIQTSVFNLFMLGDRKRDMTYAQDAYVFQLESIPAWKEFVTAVILKSREICAYLRKENKLKSHGQGKDLVLTYG